MVGRSSAVMLNGAPPNEGDHADPLDALDLFLATHSGKLGLRELLEAHPIP